MFTKLRSKMPSELSENNSFRDEEFQTLSFQNNKFTEEVLCRPF